MLACFVNCTNLFVIIILRKDGKLRRKFCKIFKLDFWLSCLCMKGTRTDEKNDFDEEISHFKCWFRSSTRIPYLKW